MKRFFLTTVIAMAAVTFVAAQETEVLTNKKGTPILPQKGSFTLGIDASPFFTNVGGIFSNNHAVSPDFGNGGVFYGQYFLTDKRALRLKTTINRTSGRLVQWVHETSQTEGDPTLKDVTIYSGSLIGLMVGLQNYVGKGRLQGFYGIEAGAGYGSEREKYTYGNALSDANPNWGQWRTLKDHGHEFDLRAGIYAGIDYFIAPGISIGGEVGWNMEFATTTRGTIERERWYQGKLETETNQGNYVLRGSRLGNVEGGIVLKFHF